MEFNFEIEVEEHVLSECNLKIELQKTICFLQLNLGIELQKIIFSGIET